MSSPAPANRRSASGSRRFNPLRALQPKRRLQQMLSSRLPVTTVPVTTASVKAPVTTPPVTVPVPAPPARKPAPSSCRDPHGNTSRSSSSNSSSCKGSDCSPTKRPIKYTSCTDNHGIRPPPPEQYLTPLQQKEVCIRHLRAHLKETVDRLQDRDSEIDELRGQLSRMQEDWVEEECHRVEAQLALKEARREIQQLQQAVDSVRSSLGDCSGHSAGVQKYFQDINTQNHKLESLLHSMELAQAGHPRLGESGGGGGGSRSGGPGVSRPGTGGGGGGGGCRSCGSGSGSPARSVTRSSTYTKLSDPADRNGSCAGDFPSPPGQGEGDSGFLCCGEGGAPCGADLLLEAAFLSEETATLLNSYAQHMPQHLPLAPQHLPHSATYEKLLPVRCGAGSSVSHPCMSHHHLYLHHLQEQAIQTEGFPGPAQACCPSSCSDLDTIAETRTFRSQACSPASAWPSDEEEEELESIVGTTTLDDTMAASSVSCCVDVPPWGGADRRGVAGEGGGPGAGRLPDGGEGLAGGRGGLKREEEEEGRPGEEAVVRLVEEGEKGRQVAAGSPGGGGRPHQDQDQEQEQPLTSQPHGFSSRLPGSTHPCELAGVTVVEVDDDDQDDEDGSPAPEEDGGAAAGFGSGSADSGAVQKSYWSRHFLVDLLAVAVPVVPTVAWLCRGPRGGGGLPVYHLGSLLRGCCTVALHSLRRGGGLRHYPAGGGDLGGTQI